jgi:hypothetical protein
VALGIVVPFTEVTFGKEVVADVMNDPVVGIVTVLMDVIPVGVVLSPMVMPLVPPSHVVPELNARFPLEVSPKVLVVEALTIMLAEPLNETVLMVRAVSNVVAVEALPVSAPVKAAELTEVSPERLVVVAPKLTLVDPTVTVLLESLSTLIFALALISASRIVPLRIIVDVTVPVSACVTAVPDIFDAAIVSLVVTSVELAGIVVLFTEVTFGKEVVAEVINDPLVGSVTPLIDVTPVGVALRAIVPVDVMVPPVRLVPAVMLVTDPLPPPAPGIQELVED